MLIYASTGQKTWPRHGRFADLADFLKPGDLTEAVTIALQQGLVEL